MNALKQIVALCILLIVGWAVQPALAQEAPKKERPDQLNVFKVNLTQFVVNEARILYEVQLRRTTSLEFGVGYVYPNAFWYDRGGSPMLASGGAGYLAFRKYFDKKRYIYQPFLRSYTSLMLFFRSTSYANQWLMFGDDVYGYQCELFSEKIQQYGGVMRFGWQSRAGRVVLDFYSGLGIKIQPRVITSHALNDSSDVCAPLPTTQYREIVERKTDVEVVLNAGIQLGIRQNNRKKPYKTREDKDRDEAMPESPPKFNP